MGVIETEERIEKKEMQKFPLDVMKYTRMSRDNLSVSYQNTDFLPCKSAVQGCKMPGDCCETKQPILSLLLHVAFSIQLKKEIYFSDGTCAMD